SLIVPAGAPGLAARTEISRAYTTTGDDNLVYWNLQSNSIVQTIPVGHNPVGLALGLVKPAGSAAPAAPDGGPTGGTAGGPGPAVGAAGGGTSAAGPGT